MLIEQLTANFNFLLDTIIIAIILGLLVGIILSTLNKIK